jgi:hypothetical protein
MLDSLVSGTEPPTLHMPGPFTSNVERPNKQGQLKTKLRQELTKDTKTMYSCRITTESSLKATNGSGLYLH